jgi:hypothetical protein
MENSEFHNPQEKRNNEQGYGTNAQEEGLKI